jgi:nucleobase:cation symporter-1, NCS1 family
MSLVDHFGHESISPSSKIERTMNGFNAFAIWCACACACAVVISVVMVGTLLIPNLTPMEAIAITVSGSLVGGLALALTGTVGSRTGLPTMVLMRAVFGQKGAVLPAVMNGLLLVGWNWIQAFMAGFSLNYAVEHTFGYSNINLFVIITGVLVTMVAIYGHRVIPPFLAGTKSRG